MAKELENQQIAHLVAKSQTRVGNLLSEYAICQPYDIEIKQFRGYRSKFMGLLRAETEFLERPIIWVNQNLIAMMKRYEVPEWEYDNVVTDTILHEIAHIIYKRALKSGSAALLNLLGSAVEASQGVNLGFSGGIEEDLEEDFCEAFALAMTDRRPCPKISTFLNEYSRIHVSSDSRLSRHKKEGKAARDQSPIHAHRSGDLVWIDMMNIPQEMRGKGLGRTLYENWEAKLPPDVTLVRLMAADAGHGKSNGFWEAMGFEYVYADGSADYETQQSMWKGVNGNPTPPQVPFEDEQETVEMPMPSHMRASDRLNNSLLENTPPALPFDRLVPESVLYLFDAPLLFTMTREAEKFLCLSMGEDEHEKFLLAEVDGPLLRDVSENIVSLRSAFTSSGAWLVSVGPNQEILKSDWFDGGAIPEALLPEAEACLNSVCAIPHGIPK